MSILRETMNSTKWLLLASVLLVASSNASVPQCCENGQDYVDNTNTCTGGLLVRMNCSRGFYIIRPESEYEYRSYHFTLDSNNDSWLHFEKFSFNFSPSEYCLSKTEAGEEVILNCFPDQDEAFELFGSEWTWKNTVVGILSMISSIFLGLTLFVYLVLPELREVQDKAMMSMTVSFMFAFFLTGHLELNQLFATPESSTCLIAAFCMYYAFMCAFSWLNVISLNIWKSVWCPSFRVSNNKLYAFYCAIGWGLPLCFLALLIVGHKTNDSHSLLVNPEFGVYNCWFHDSLARWFYFYGPIMVLLTMNLIYLSLTAWKLWHQYNDLSSCKLKVLRKCSICVKLGLLMGFTWIFEVISFATETGQSYYWIPTDFMNALQGVVIFLILVVFRKRVRKLLAQRRPFNIPFPKSWAAYADVENCDVVRPEDLELSQSS